MTADTQILYCAWCKTITIDTKAVGDVALILFPEFRRAYVNGVPAHVADGLCQHCRATKFPEFPKKAADESPKKVTDDLATK